MKWQKLMKEIIIIGWIRKGKPADCGETMKNQLLIQKLKELGVRCYQIDFKDWRKHPWVFLTLLYTMIFHHKATIIFSTSAQNVYPMMRLMMRLKVKQHTVHWVIGGSLGSKVVDGTFSSDVIGYMDWTLVESQIMVDQLKRKGIANVMQVPNFKPIPYKPLRGCKGKTFRFVFVSRIMPEKGCDYIIECAKLLNGEGYENKYEIDFYGKIAETYKEVFNNKLEVLSNVNYKGFLNLRENNGYDKLATYDIMLFPTYWKGEGFAGIFIDAFVAGVPLIASDWAHNRQFLEDGKTALFVPVHNIPALADRMRECLNNKYDLEEMSHNCQKEADMYNIDNVVTNNLLSKIGII